MSVAAGPCCGTRGKGPCKFIMSASGRKRERKKDSRRWSGAQWTELSAGEIGCSIAGTMPSILGKNIQLFDCALGARRLEVRSLRQIDTN